MDAKSSAQAPAVQQSLSSHDLTGERARQLLVAIVESSDDAIVSKDLNGIIVSWNKGAERLFGYPAAEVIGRPITLLIPPDHLDEEPRILERISQGQPVGHYETVRRRKNGSLVQISLAVSPVKDAEGRIVGASKIARDITGRKQVEESLAKRIDEQTALFEFTNSLLRAGSPEQVYSAALDAIVRSLRCDRASILLFDGSGTMRFVASRGLSEAYCKAVEGHSPWQPGEKHPAPIFVYDFAMTDESEALKATIAQEGIRALGFIPILAKRSVIGKFMTYYDRPHACDDHERDLALTIARQLGFSLERMRADEAGRSAEAALRESEERFRLMSEQAPVMIWLSDTDGRCLHLNRMLRTFWNVDDTDLSSFDWQSMMHPEDAPEIVRRTLEALTARSGFTLEGRYLCATGEYRMLRTDAQPRFSSDGEFLGMIGVNVDITERGRAENALRESEERFRLAVEAAPSGMVLTNHQGHIVLVNEHAEHLFGYSREELYGQTIEVLVPERFRSTHPDFRSHYGRSPDARPMGAGRDLFALRKDGGEVPVEIGLSPFETSQGLMVLAAVVDISERKRADAQRELLVAELDHRVKNTLAVVQGIAHQTFKGTDVPVEVRNAFEGRLVALATAHNLLTQANWGTASLDELTIGALTAAGAEGGRRVSLLGPPVLLPPKQALAMSMALHELCTNALKYGALSNAVGQVKIEWAASDDAQPRLRLVWQERGGPPVTAPKRRGFGTRMIEQALTRDLDGQVTMDFEPAGLVCTIEAVLPAGGQQR